MVRKGLGGELVLESRPERGEEVSVWKTKRRQVQGEARDKFKAPDGL